jgi:hypothetical protein
MILLYLEGHVLLDHAPWFEKALFACHRISEQGLTQTRKCHSFLICSLPQQIVPQEDFRSLETS